jgi:hypothetical protein
MINYNPLVSLNFPNNKRNPGPPLPIMAKTGFCCKLFSSLRQIACLSCVNFLKGEGVKATAAAVMLTGIRLVAILNSSAVKASEGH